MTNVVLKYNIKDRGLKLEMNNPLKAIDFYSDLLAHEYFINDYYPYRRLVLMYEKIGDCESGVGIISDFFKSGIYCNEYNFSWFEHKLQLLADDGYIKRNEINNLTEVFRNTGFKNKHLENVPLPIADRIRKKSGKVIVEAQSQYDKRQKQYALDVRLSELKRQNRNSEYIDLLNHMIDDLNYKKPDYYKRLSIAYKKSHDRDNELRVIKKYLNNISSHKKSDYWFEKRLKELNQPKITFKLKNEDYERNPFYEYNKKLDELENIKRKAVLIEYGKTLEVSDAISYYKYLCSNTYFSNDWYPYRQLTILYEKTCNPNANLVNIKKLLQSKIYLNDYQFLWFGEKIRGLMDETNVDDETVERWFDDYEIHGAVNKFRLNKYLADKFISEDNEITVMNNDEFEYDQNLKALREKGLIYERVGNYELAVKHYVNIINEKEYNYCEFYRRLCDCLDEIRDYRREVKAIRLYYTSSPIDMSECSEEWFLKRLDELNRQLDSDFTADDLRGLVSF